MRQFIFLALTCLMAAAGCTAKKEKTIENIKLGIQTETTASVKYAAYSQKALAEGLDTIARLFLAASKAEAIHAASQSALLELYKRDMDPYQTPSFKIGTTADNLQESINDESIAVNSMYPMFIADAKSKRLKKATIQTLTWALETEKKHIDLFKKALEGLKAKSMMELPSEYIVCPVCGNTCDKQKAPETCSICGTNKDLFVTNE